MRIGNRKYLQTNLRFHPRTLITLFFFLIIRLPAGAAAVSNDTLHFHQAIDRLRILGDSLLKGSSNETRSHANEKFHQLLDSILHTPGGELLSLYQVKALSVIQSRDKRLKAITWMLSMDRGSTFYYHGYLIVKPDSKAPVSIKRLLSRTDINRDELESIRFTDSSWVGCIYYDIVQTSYRKKTYYLILGWAPQSTLVTRKLAEALRLNDDGSIAGQPTIRAGGKSRSRLVFDYNSSATMSLRFEQKLKMVVMDHLSPSDPRPEARGTYSLYGPDLSYDGLRFLKGYWQLIRDIDVRNR